MFALRLARDLGKSLTEVLQFPTVEFGYWMAFYNIEPYGEQEDSRAALLSAVIVNSSGRYKKSFKPKDFMPKRKKMQQSVDEQIMMFRKLTRKTN